MLAQQRFDFVSHPHESLDNSLLSHGIADFVKNNFCKSVEELLDLRGLHESRVAASVR